MFWNLFRRNKMKQNFVDPFEKETGDTPEYIYGIPYTSPQMATIIEIYKIHGEGAAKAYYMLLPDRVKRRLLQESNTRAGIMIMQKVNAQFIAENFSKQ